MVNIKAKIEKLKDTRFIFSARGHNEAEWLIDDVLNILNQYNIVATPKTFKLSEIINKLEKELNESLYIEKYKNSYDVFFKDYDDYELVNRRVVFTINESMEISDIYLNVSDKYKWFYSLWNTGVKIIDDLEGTQNE